jgi:hypothetical protein
VWLSAGVAPLVPLPVFLVAAALSFFFGFTDPFFFIVAGRPVTCKQELVAGQSHEAHAQGLGYFAFYARAESFVQNPAFAQNAGTNTLVTLAAAQPTPSEALITSYAGSHSELQLLMLQVFS